MFRWYMERGSKVYTRRESKIHSYDDVHHKKYNSMI